MFLINLLIIGLGILTLLLLYIVLKLESKRAREMRKAKERSDESIKFYNKNIREKRLTNLVS